MWYLLDADEGAAVFAGLQPGTDAKRFTEAIESCEFEDVLKRVPVKAGDAVFIPGGRVHAIDRGCLILEVQQSSNTTYRIYDWGRVDATGKARDLHIEQAAQVTLWDDDEDARVVPERLEGATAGERWLIYESPYFRMERWQVVTEWTQTATPESFQVLFNAKGHTRLSWDGGELDLHPGTSCLIPAALDGFRLQPRDRSTVLRVTVP
jgi:mannose-6-phosphate isomerase